MTHSSTILAAVALAALAGCSSNDSGDDASPTGGTSSGGAPGSAGASFGGAPNQGSTEQVGRIDVTVTAPRDGAPGAVTFIGKFYPSPYPVQTNWDVSETDGACRLLLPVFPFCDPGCGSAVCVTDDTCVSYPALVNAGTLTVQGLSTQSGGALSVKPLSDSNLVYQPTASAGLTYPGTTPGVPLIVDGAGGLYGAFHLEAKGILPFTLVSDDPIRVAPGEPARIEWTTSAGSDARIEIELEISHHGGVKGQVVCDVPDTGAFDVPAALVTKLVALGVSGFPTVIVTRRSVDSAAVPMGRVDLVIASRVDHPVEIPGLVSCSTDAECSGGQTCQQDKQCK